MDPRLAYLTPLLDEMAKRGYLDAWLVRHHLPEVEAHVEGAVARLVSKTASKLGYNARRVIESEAESVDSVVASTLIETTHQIVNADPVVSFMDQINGRHRVVPRAVANDVLDLGRKIKVRKLPVVAEEDGYEVAAVEDHDIDRLDSDTPDAWLAAVALMHQRGQRMTLKNLAATLGVSDRHLRRIRAAQK
jgi:hypothetical protein